MVAYIFIENFPLFIPPSMVEKRWTPFSQNTPMFFNVALGFKRFIEPTNSNLSSNKVNS